MSKICRLGRSFQRALRAVLLAYRRCPPRTGLRWLLRIQGQTHRVGIVKLVAQGTIEERILGLQERKAALAESMYSGAVGRKQPLFSESDLAELLKTLFF